MTSPADVVTIEFPAATGIKRRPAGILSTKVYHQTRPDRILGLLTSQELTSSLPTDYVLLDWVAAGLRKPSTFRSFLAIMPAFSVKVIGHLSERDWKAVQICLQAALSFT